MTVSSDERKCPSEPSELAERKTNRLKRKDLRSACKQISGLSLLFSSKRVCCHCGARHNIDLNLSGTESECVIRLWAIGKRFMMGLSANTFYRRVREYKTEYGIAEPTSA